MQLKLIVFDWDGTLMDSTAHITRSVQTACAQLGLPIPSDSDSRYIIGLGLAQALKTVAPQCPEDQIPALIDAYRTAYFSGDETLQLFDGVREAIEHFHAQNTLLAIATGKSRIGLNRALKETQLDAFFPLIATRTVDECPSKPHPQMLLELMEYFGVKPNETVMIGDTTHDLLMAQHANTHAIGIESGAHSREQLEACAPIFCAKNFLEMNEWLKARC